MIGFRSLTSNNLYNGWPSFRTDIQTAVHRQVVSKDCGLQMLDRCFGSGDRKEGTEGMMLVRIALRAASVSLSVPVRCDR